MNLENSAYVHYARTHMGRPNYEQARDGDVRVFFLSDDKMDVNAPNIVRIPLKANVPSKKKYNVAKFHAPTLDFSTFAKPVRMYRAPAETPEQPPPPPPQSHERQPFKKKFIPPLITKPKKKELTPWHIEDSQGNNAYDGTKEGGQTANYVLLVYENSAFHVIPCNEWYNFKPMRTYQTLSLEEAEAKMHVMKLKGERAAIKMEKNPKELAKEKEKQEAGPSSIGQRDKEDEEFSTRDEEDADKFAAFGKGADEEEGKPKAKARKAKKTGDEEGEADNEEDDEGEKDEEEPDWKGMFDDDEEEGAPEDAEEEEPKGMRDNDAEGEGDGEDSALTDAGKELRKILKNHRDEDSEASDVVSESDDEDDDFDEDKLPELGLRFPKLPSTPPLGEKPSAETKSEDSLKKEPTGDSVKPTTPPLPGSPSKEKKKSKSKKDSKGSSKSKGKEPKETTPKLKSESKSKKAGNSPPPLNTDSPTVSTPPTTTGTKRSAEGSAGDTSAKKAKTEPFVTEAEVIRLLKKHPKGLATLDFIKHFKAAIASDPAQKTKLTQLTTKICAMDGKMLVLKNEFK